MQKFDGYLDDEQYDGKYITTVEEWIEIHKLSTLYSVYKQYPTDIFEHPELKYLSMMDHNSVLFHRFLTKQQPIITIEYFYVCIGYIFNINYSIKDKIALTTNYGIMLNTKPKSNSKPNLKLNSTLK